MDRFQHGRSGANFRTMLPRDQSKIAAFCVPVVTCLTGCFSYRTRRYGILHKPQPSRLARIRLQRPIYRYNRRHFAIPDQVFRP
ncbi:hypothetical protein [Pseudomonas sp. N040]|uniref:hypothetical protein n=1 Tax=Pseudomonas sp. N040 TaxID=2785325 RepID=UPI0018A2BF10|nr:hypothetical protein [Pseudomonas sp. N040]MBF7730277.1 hypothetical protein [Pseudomonas sp. N040]MBW7013919.1 hypothetical protein [Pseudomonas sp. N040]